MAEPTPLNVLERRFWQKVNKTPGGCWNWQGTIGRDRVRKSGGYGRWRVGEKIWMAHRYAYTLAVGPIPDGALVCHSCDNRVCVNPDHLWLGTHLDNAKDRDSKGRLVTGHWSRLAKPGTEVRRASRRRWYNANRRRGAPDHDKTMTAKMLDTLAAFTIEPEIRTHALGRQAVSLVFADGTRAHRSARSTLYALVDRGFLENSIVGNQRAVRLTAKGKEFLDS